MQSTNVGGDSINANIGNDVRNANIGKDINSNDSRATVNNYIDRDERSNTTVEARLSRLEQLNNATQDTLRRIVTLMDGDVSWRIIGLPDQLSAYIKANEDWKKATEQRIAALEEGYQIVMHPTTAFWMAVTAILLIIGVYIAISWLQRGST